MKKHRRMSEEEYTNYVTSCLTAIDGLQARLSRMLQETLEGKRFNSWGEMYYEARLRILNKMLEIVKAPGEEDFIAMSWIIEQMLDMLEELDFGR